MRRWRRRAGARLDAVASGAKNSEARLAGRDRTSPQDVAGGSFKGGAGTRMVREAGGAGIARKGGAACPEKGIRSARARTRRALGTEKEGFEPSRQGFPHLTP